MAFVYILQSDKGRYYIGSTTDMVERLKHHAGGYTPSTKALGKMRLVLQQEYATISGARKVEARLKRLKRKDYIAKIVKDGHIKIPG
jgi:predicted GIY-YIG superfamily endonuclease